MSTTCRCGANGWLRGLTDPAVTKALSIIHTRYAEELDVEGLAREAGVSRTILGEKFAELHRRTADALLRALADAHGRQHAARRQGRSPQTSHMRSASTARPRSTGRSSANMACRRRLGESAKKRSGWRRRRAALPLPAQDVQYAVAADGTRLAWSAIGDGPPLVKTANWLNHFEFDFESPIWRGWIKELAADFRLIRYDERGNGLSDWNTPELSLDAFVDDLACVVDAAGVREVRPAGDQPGRGGRRRLFA